jgi:hypothetical protein
MMTSRLGLVAASLLLVCGPGAGRAAAGVVVLDNRTQQDVEFTIRQTDGKDWRYTLLRGDLMPVPAAGRLGIAFESDGQPRRQELEVNTIYFFAGSEKHVDLVELRFPGAQGKAAGPAQPAPADPAHPAAVAPTDPVVTIPVVILADDNEPMAQAAWEKRIRSRLAEASKIFEHHCRVRFEPVAAGTWKTDPHIVVFEKSLQEFTARATPQPPARIAIGFTSRYQWVPGEMHLGATRGPLFPYVLIRNALQGVSEPERLEVLVHELGHYLGAVHAPQNVSVMRPNLGDQKSRLLNFRIRFDAPNTLVMYLVAEEMRIHPIVSLAQLSPERKAVLRAVYTAMGQVMAQAVPKDFTAAQYLAQLNSPAPPLPPPWRSPTPSAPLPPSPERRVQQPSATSGAGLSHPG